MTGVTRITAGEHMLHTAVRLGEVFGPIDERSVPGTSFLLCCEGRGSHVKIGFILFDGMTTLDFIGFYEAVTRLALMGVPGGVAWDFCSDKDRIVDDRGLAMDGLAVKPDLGGYDLVFVPGGMATRQLRFDESFVGWLRTAAPVRYKVSVCTGALLLGAAGFLEGRRATTNRSAYERLAPYCAEVVKTRVMRDGDVFTGGGVSAAIDLGLYVIESLFDADLARSIQEQMEYPYYTPGSGSPEL